MSEASIDDTGAENTASPALEMEKCLSNETE